MRTKYTKRQYLKDIAANDEAVTQLGHDLNEALAKFEAGNASPELSDHLNALHDREWQLNDERRDIEMRWTCRNWTSADWASHELAAANID